MVIIEEICQNNTNEASNLEASTPIKTGEFFVLFANHLTSTNIS